MGRIAAWLGFQDEPQPRDAPIEIRAPLRSRVATHTHTATDGRDILLNTPDGWEVEQPWLWWTGPAGGDGTGGPFGNPPPGAGDPALAATNIPAVARCTSIIVDTIAGLPWHVFTGWTQLPTPSWIDDPQALRQDGRIHSDLDPVKVRLSAVEFWAQWITSALWFGDGFVWVPVRDASGAPKPPLWILHPHDVTIEDGRYFVGDSGVELPPEQVIHLRGEPPYRAGHGTGVIDRHGADLALAATVRSFAGSTYGNGVPAGYLKVNAPNLTQPQADDLKSRWMAAHGGTMTRRSIAILNATTEFHPIALNPVDGQLDSAREWSLRDIALAFGVPPYMLGVPGDSSTYANVESRMIELRTFTLLPWIRRIESTLDAQLPRGTSVKVSTDATLRGDTLSRYQSYTLGLSGGFLTVDEVRAMENRPPLPQQTANPADGELPPLPSSDVPPDPAAAPADAQPQQQRSGGVPRRVVLVLGAPGSGKTTYAKTLGLPLFDRDDWPDERTFKHDVKRACSRSDAQAVVIRSGTTELGIRHAYALTDPTEVKTLDPGREVCESRVRQRGTGDIDYQLDGIARWYASRKVSA